MATAAVVLGAAGAATGQTNVIDFEGAAYPAGPLVTLAGPAPAAFTNVNGWKYATAGQATTGTARWNVSNTVASPNGGGTQSLRVTGGADARIALDLANPVTSGVVKIQYDVFKPTGGEARVIPLAAPADWDGADNLYGNGDDQSAGDPNFFAQIYNSTSNDWFGFFGRVGEATTVAQTGFSIFQPVTPPNNNPNGYPRKDTQNGRWYRVAMYFNLDDAESPVVYGELFDLSCGATPFKIGEYHSNFNSPGLSQIRTSIPSGRAVRSIQVRSRTDATDVFVDNIRVEGLGALGSGFVLPPPVQFPAQPGPTPRPADLPTVAKTASVAFTLPAAAGRFPSMAYAPATQKLFTFDANNRLVRVDLSTPVPTVTPWDDGAEINTTSYLQPTQVMSVTSDGSTLYFLADNVTDPANPYPPGSPCAVFACFPWRDLNSYSTATQNGSWTLVKSGDTAFAGGSGDHSASLLTAGGKRYFMHAWMGNTQYTAFNITDAAKGPTIGGVGNRWPGATTEAFADGTTGSQFFALAKVNADGTRSTASGLEYEGIFKFDLAAENPCTINTGPSLATGAPVSASYQVLPWVTSANDGSTVNKHAMEFVPNAGAQGQIWVARAAGSPEIFVYDIATDTRQIVYVLDASGNVVNLTAPDLQLIGTDVWILNGDSDSGGGRATVYKVPIGGPTTPVVRPGNDNCANATAVGEGSIAFNTAFASDDGPAQEFFCEQGVGGTPVPDVWFLYTATRDGDATVSLCAGTSFDSIMNVYPGATGCPAGNDTAIACDDDGCSPGGPSQLVIEGVTVGSSYYIRVGGFARGAGPGTLSISIPSACRADFNNDAAVNVSDIFAFLSAWFAELPSANINGDGAVDVSDIFAFLSIWFAGCP